MIAGHSKLVRLAFVTLVAFWLGAACSGSVGGPEGSTGCTEGRSVQCTCTNAESGAQTCRPDGTWGPCECDAPPSPDDTGMSVDTDGADTHSEGDANPADTSDPRPVPDTGSPETDSGSDAQSPEEYRTVTVPAGDKKQFDVGPGETLENLLVDITADGAGVFFDVEGGTLRPIGIEGENVAEDTFAHVSAPDPNGEVRIENVYVGDGTDADEGEAGGFWVDATDDAHRGVGTFRNGHVAGFNDNGIYGSGPGHQLE